MPGIPCRAITKKGKPCPVPARQTGYCLGHDPSITSAMRKEWRKRSRGVPRVEHAEYRFMSPGNVIEYASNKLARIEELHKDSLEALPAITDLLRVIIAANRILRDKSEIRAMRAKDHGPRTIRIVRDEPDAVRPISNAGQ